MAKKKLNPTVNIDAVKREAKKESKKIIDSNPAAFGKELSAGSVRRESVLEQEMGPSKYKQMIHRHNQENKHILDRLPFTFPPKKKIRSHLNVSVSCSECGYQTLGSEHTVGFVCPTCEEYVSVVNEEASDKGYHSDIKVGIFGSARDLLEAREKARKK